MNCISKNCKYLKGKIVKDDSSKFFKGTLVPYCQLGRPVSHLFIDDGKKELRCECYVKAGSEDKK